ncbi:hypothetical protein niasHT_004478 [Heterodera trifolii]|uniref:UDP-glucuronosyltransferase n=1 Tax=Heterodera trifolii TaxID=157864 RepID=A0ABD2MFT0_9BILA
MLPMIEKFASRGHSVTILDTILPVEKQKPFIHHIRAPLPIVPTNDEERRQLSFLLWSMRLIQPTFAYVYHISNKDFGLLLSNYSEQVTEIVNTDWDLIVVDDIFWSFGFALTTMRQRLWESNGGQGQRKRPHYLVYATSGTSVTVHNSIRATGRSWVERPQMCAFLPTDEESAFTTARFSHRVSNFIEIFMEFISVNFIVESFLMPNIAKFGVPNFNWFEFLWHSEMFFFENIDRMGMPLAVGPEMIATGAHCEMNKNLQKLPGELSAFMEKPNSKGVIYVAFGTHVDWKYAPEHLLNAFFDAFNRLTDYQIIFACKGCEEKPKNLNQNVMIVKWAPQNEILTHPNTKAFITHGGFKSVREGICAAVPLIIMPVLAEQAHNAHVLLKTRIASAIINKYYITETNLFNIITNMLSRSDEHVARAKKLGEIYLDRPIPSMDEGIFAVEHRIFGQKHGNGWLRYTRRNGMKMGWMEFSHLDLIGIIFFAAIILCL